MKAKPTYLPVPESLQLLVTQYALAVRTSKSSAVRVRALGAVIIQALEKAPKRTLVLDGLEIRLVKKWTIRTRPSNAPGHVQTDLTGPLREYLVARSRHEAAQFAVDVLGPVLIERLNLRKRRKQVVEGWELKLVKSRVVRCRIVDAVAHGRFFRERRG